MASFSPRDVRGRGKRRSGVALFKSVSLWFSKGARSRDRHRDGGGGGMRPETAARGPNAAPSSAPIVRKPTHFSKEETEALTMIYEKLIGAGKSASASHHPSVSTAPLLHVKAKEGLERSVFRDLLHNTFNICAEDILMERIFCVFDNSSDGLVKLEEWLQGMSVFLRGTLEERIVFSFNVYDLNTDGFIVREEIFTLLRNSLVKQPQDEDPEEGWQAVPQRFQGIGRGGTLVFGGVWPVPPIRVCRSRLSRYPFLNFASGQSWTFYYKGGYHFSEI
ncbi:hypothetical protein GE061_010720 [Apolygus lucorum]|uniref:EF-hand domain-containing protein n=1 Tax=Apolygus lucorum TaxID=248454 RepID=A0A6A4K8N3_APOLU|nr:hypothetical protein GE061_010720 [Apolygus lucorum]